MTAAEIEKLRAFISDAIETGVSSYPGMTYEDGIRDVLDVLEGEPLNELIGEE